MTNLFGPEEITCEHCHKVYTGFPEPFDRLPPLRNFCSDECRVAFDDEMDAAGLHDR